MPTALISTAVAAAEVEVLRRLVPGTTCLFVREGDRHVPDGHDALLIDPHGPHRTLVHDMHSDALDRICFLVSHKNETVVEELAIPHDGKFRLLAVTARPVWSEGTADGNGELIGVLCSGVVTDRRSLFGRGADPLPQELLESSEQGRFKVRYEPAHDPRTGRLLAVHASLVLTRDPGGPGDTETPIVDLLPGLDAAGLLPEIELALLVSAAKRVSLWNRLTRSRIRLVCTYHGPQSETGEVIRNVRLALSMSGLAPELFTLLFPGARAVRGAAVSVAMHLAGLGMGTGVSDLFSGHADLLCFSELQRARFTIPESATGGDLATFARLIDLAADWVGRIDGQLHVAGVASTADVSGLAAARVSAVSGPLFSPPLTADQFGDYVTESVRSDG